MALCIALASCTDDIVPEMKYVGETDYVSFVAELDTIQEGTLTRAAYAHYTVEISEWRATGDTMHTRAYPTTELTGSAGIIAFAYTGNWSASASTLTPELLYNEKFNFNGESLTSDTLRTTWMSLGDKNTSFFAYAPYGIIDGSTAVLSDSTATGTPTITYTVPTEVAKQQDLLYACHKDYAASQKQAVPLTFNHALTAVCFKLGFSDVTIKSLTVRNVIATGKFSLDGTWDLAGSTPDASYTFDFGEDGAGIAALANGNNTLMVIPQKFGTNSPAMIELTYVDDLDGSEHTLTGSLAGTEWQQGKRLTYTIYRTEAPKEYIYFDLAAGNITINNNTYSGSVYVNGTVKQVTGTHLRENEYYVYQSSTITDSPGYKTRTGYATMDDFNNNKQNIRIPEYPEVTHNGMKWSDYITNNTDVLGVIQTWPTEAEKAGRTKVTQYKIKISGTSTYSVCLDNIYSGYAGRHDCSIEIIATNGGENHIMLKGDNKVCGLAYNCTTKGNGYLRITSEKGDGNNEGSLTACFEEEHLNNTLYDCNPLLGSVPSSQSGEYGLTFNGGTIYAGNPPLRGSVWDERNQVVFPVLIGGACNSDGEVTINGGRITAVANATSAAIGAGGGMNLTGADGFVYINGGDVYAYNFGVYTNQFGGRVTPCTAIGGSNTLGLSNGVGGNATVVITGGNVYAQSVGGVAIGGGGSASKLGGNGIVTITGGNVIAKSVSGYVGGHWTNAGTAIGGGTGGVDPGVNGGDAIVTISGHPTITTGSFGGGKENSADHKGKIGTAQIDISGSPTISGQFVMAAGAATAPSFLMTGGTIQHSSTFDTDFVKIQEKGGAVYMEEGTCHITGGTIADCRATQGGAVYMKDPAGEGRDHFTIENGVIRGCSSTEEGGAVFMDGGDFTITSGTIDANTSGTQGGALYMGKGVFSISGGVMSNNVSGKEGGGIYIVDGTVDINGGNINGNHATGNGGGIWLGSGNVTMTGGNITKNMANGGDGGGICILGGNFYMTEGTQESKSLKENSATVMDGQGGNGGGVYVSASGSDKHLTVDLLAGDMSGNTSSKHGGGIYVDMKEGATADITIGNETTGDILNPFLGNNYAGLSGGGLDVEGTGSDITIWSGTINGNVSAYVSNTDIRNEGGMVTLAGAADKIDVKYKIVKFYANNEVDPELTAEQWIVTSTNSLLVPPRSITDTWTKQFHTFSHWNTKRDGTGISYTKEGYVYGTTTPAIMNIDSNVALYAQWTTGN